ncbi:MAG TPA: protein phosphatase 2C domain-containing protein, partial [Aggregatilineales bacterium]|nr:protein phosphatase 2C domain-containing protein [Aggregatilineales bacterium]
MADFSKSLEAFGLTDVGRKRKRNEDFFRYVIPTANSPEEALGAFFVVADGIGGMGFGEEASSVAVNTLLAAYYDPQNPDPDPLSRLRAAMNLANNAVIAKAGELGRTLIGTTASGIIVHPKEIVLFNVGDARVYRIRGSFIERLSRDQSVLEEQLALGLVTEEEAAQGRNMNVTAFVGQPGGVEPVYRRVSAQADDIFLICSDGLWDLVKENELVQIIPNNTPESAIQQLVTMVLERGAPDNTTGIIVRMTPFKKKAVSKIVPILFALALMIGIAVGVVAILSNNPSPLIVDDSTQTADVTEDMTPAGVVILPTEGETETLEVSVQATVIEMTANVVIGTIEGTSEVTPDVTAIMEITSPAETTPDVSMAIETSPEVTATESTPEITPDEVRNVAITEETPEVSPTVLPTNTPTLTVTPSPTQTKTATATATTLPTNTDIPSPTVTPSPTNTMPPTATLTNTPTATSTATTKPPTATLDSESLTLVFPFTATARANLPPETQTAISNQETQVAIDALQTQTQVAFFATETAVYPVTAVAQTLQV